MRNRRDLSRLLIPILALAGCPNGNGHPEDADLPDAPDPDAPEVTLTLEADSETTLTVSTYDGLTLERRGESILSLPLDGFELGTVSSLDDGLNYDPSFFEEDQMGLYRPPRGLEWHLPTVARVNREGDSITLDLWYEGGRRAQVELSASAEGRFEARWQLPEGDPPAVFTRLWFRADPEDHYYGLGEVFDHVDHRGMVRAMQLEAAPVESGYNEAHVPIPLLIATSGWGLYVDSRRPGVFAMATDEEDLVRVTYGLGRDAGQGLSFYLISEDRPLDVTRHYYELTGFPGPVAPWALGPLIWRDEIDGQDVVEEDLRTIRELDLADTGYWIDRPYASAVNTFDFEPADYHDPEAMVSLAHDLGIRMALWHTPYVNPDEEASRPLSDHAEANGFFPPESATAMGPWGPPLDFTNPDAYAWWQERLEPYRDQGIEGYKLDYGEEVIIGAFGIRLPWLFHDGADEMTMHRGYQLLYHQAYAEMLPAEGGFLICRAAVAGDQVNGTIIWPGDIDGTMGRFGQTMIEEDGGSYIGVGGLPSAVVAGSSLGPSGFALFGSDTGGYRHTPPARETFIRWFQHTALSPVMQVGTSANDLPWDLGDIGLDEEVLELYRRYARLHLRLFPYLWSAWRRLGEDGRAIQRPLGLAHPELGEHPDDVYLLGDHLLVAPVVDTGVTERQLTFPEGVWQSWWDGALYQGRATVPAPLETIPLFVRLWQPIPMLRPTIDTLSPVADPSEVDSMATTADPLWVRVATHPAAEEMAVGESRLYDGTSLDTEAQPADPGCVELRLGRAAGSVFTGAAVFELIGGEAMDLMFTASGGDPELLEGAADRDAFDAAESAWIAVGEGRVLIKVPGEGSVELVLCGG
jgi:alpha-D-xyloside xylohydrolase